MLSRRLLRIKVIKALYSHFKSNSDSLTISEKNLLLSVGKTYDLYFQLLWLPVKVMRYAEKRIELGKNKKLPTREDLEPNTKFIDNKVIKRIESSDNIGKYLDKKSLGWVNYPELIKSLYTDLIETEVYKKYMETPSRSFKEDLKLVENFYLAVADDNESLESVIEEQSIFWADDLDFALLMVMRTLESCREKQDDIPILPEFKNEDDQQFLKDLFRRSLAGYPEYIDYIEKYTENWDVERIAFMDNLIMVTAIAEILTFPSIPVKVSMDEYIEISKYYSTPGSSIFINGVLDKVVDTLTQEGRINKTGRGLL